MKFDKITIKNYKCFNETGCVIENIKSVNVIIGKNNSGKSSLIETIQFLTDGNKPFLENKRNNFIPEIICEHKIEKQFIDTSFPLTKSGGQIGMNHNHYGQTFVNSFIEYSLGEGLTKIFNGVSKEYINEALPYFNNYLNRVPSPFQTFQFRHLSAERDVQPENQKGDIEIEVNGTGATNLIQSIINRDVYNSELIETELLNELNKILNPDIKFSRILVQQNASNVWEIYFESEFDGRVPLSKMGSGIKTVLLVLIIIYVKPKIDKGNLSNYVFALEELENNLHPSLQRKLYYYLYEFSQKNRCVFFLTTHSNIVIDLFNSLKDTQIFHIHKSQGTSSINSIITQSEFKKILSDLEVKASDILQSNGIIWVEGPSDRTYINKWIQLIDNNLIEGYHYSIMFYGGRLLSNVTFDFLNNELIPLLKLNTNAFVIMDRDGKGISQKLNETKTRIQNEIGTENVWITKGREIENYLTNNVIEAWLSTTHKINCKFINSLNTKIEDSISKFDTSKKLKYNLNKNKYSSEIIQFITTSDLHNLDLNNKIMEIVSTIKKWNKI